MLSVTIQDVMFEKYALGVFFRLDRRQLVHLDILKWMKRRLKPNN